MKLLYNGDKWIYQATNQLLKDLFTMAIIKSIGGLLNRGGVCLLVILQIIFSSAVMALGCYGLITKNFEFQWVMMLFLALTTLVIAIREFQQKKTFNGWLYISVFLFLFFILVYYFLPL